MGGSGVKKDAFANSGTAQNLSANANANAANIYGTLLPQFENESVNPQGFGPVTKANMNTKAQQSAGGSMAGAVGQGALYAARTRNAGAGDAAIAQSSRTSGENASKAALNTELQDALLKEKQRKSGQAGMGNLYSENLNAGQNYLGLSNNSLQVANNAKPTFWQQLGQHAANGAVDALEMGAGF